MNAVNLSVLIFTYTRKLLTFPLNQMKVKMSGNKFGIFILLAYSCIFIECINKRVYLFDCYASKAIKCAIVISRSSQRAPRI